MSTYSETINFLFSQLPQYQKIGSKAYKSDLSNIIAICDTIGNPHLNIKAIHVAGSNGKGSVCHMLASILHEAGYKVGLYTSPHLKDFRERIKINGKKISEEEVVGFINKFHPKFKDIQPSFFEWTVGLAFYFFNQQNTDINIIETGLGGRLDSTNIIHPKISVITNISLEHTKILGDTLEQIAQEKAGIIKPQTPIVIGRSQLETKQVFISKAKENNSQILFADIEKKRDFELDLKGEIQQQNAQTAFQTISVLNSLDSHISDENVKNGLKNVIKNTGLLGRFQLVNNSPVIIYDTAHNPDGLRTLIKEIMKLKPHNLHAVIGIAKDKNQLDMLSVFPKESSFYFCSSSNDRVMQGYQLKAIAKQLNLQGESFKTVEEGLRSAKKEADKKDVIVVTGSNFIVADIL